jgi:TP901 family phage tail tape measure protein
MANENIVTNITVTSNFSDLIGDVNKVTASLAKLQQSLVTTDKAFANQVAKINASFASALNASGQFSTHFVSLTSDAEKFGKSLESGKLKLRDYYSTLNNHVKTSGGLIRDLAKQQVMMQNAIVQPLGKNAQGLMQYNIHVARGLDEIVNKTKIAAQQAAIMNKVIQQGAGQLINWGKNTQWAGRQLTVGLTVPIAAFGKAAADAFRMADQELVRLTKVYGGVAATSTTELRKIRQEVSLTAAQLAKSYGATYKDTIALAADLAATGKTGKELIASTRETTRLAVLGEVDRQDAMKATLAIQNAFKQNTNQLTESINFLNAVENQTSTSLADLIEAIPKAGPVIQGMGGSVKDLALYLTAMREGGINAAEGANALKSSLASLINPTKVATEMFNGFGIDLKGIVTRNAGNLTETILQLQASLDKLNPLQKQQALEQLFGKFQFARMNALFANLGKQGSQTLQVLDLMKASTQDLANIAGRELSQVTESASGRYRRAIEGLKADLAGLGESFLNISTGFINAIDKLVKLFNNLPDPIKKVVSGLGIITAMVGPIIMLTGVLANFAGYIIKAASHFRAFFKGAEGWKLLTPEMIAANNAANLMEKTFYNDAKAASVLKGALSSLINELTILQTKASTGSISVMPSVYAATNAATTGVRQVNPNSPLVGPMGTRASAHMVPRAGMTPEQRANQTFFGMVPSSIPVNQYIGQNPMIYATGDLPKVPGLTSIETKRGPVSTGVVAGEAAKWHAMNATLSMMSKAELNELKKSVAQTGVATQAFMNSFEAVLPTVTKLTTNAARESELIVAEVTQGKIAADAARQRIIALNLQIEQAMAAEVSTIAGNMGRTANLTTVPTLNQPVVNATGKSNMREIFKKAGSANFFNKLAGILGVRTSGAGYNIETTIPKRLNAGGGVFYNNGDQVPGPNVNADVVPAMLTPGEFVIRRDVAQQDPEGMRALNSGQAMIVPIQNRFNGGAILSALAKRALQIGGARARYLGSRSGPSARKLNEPDVGSLTYYDLSRSRNLRGWEQLSGYGQIAPNFNQDTILHGATSSFRSRLSGLPKGRSATGIANRQQMENFGINLGSSKYEEFIPLPNNFVVYRAANSRAFNTQMDSPGGVDTRLWAGVSGSDMTSLAITLRDNGVPENLAKNILNFAAAKLNSKIRSKSVMTGEQFGDYIDQAQQEAVSYFSNTFNSGGEVPGYAGGGNVISSLLQHQTMMSGLPSIFKSQLFKRFGAMFSSGKKGYTINALKLGQGKRFFGEIPGLSERGQNTIYGAFMDSAQRSIPTGWSGEPGSFKRALSSQDLHSLSNRAMQRALLANISGSDKAAIAAWLKQRRRNAAPSRVIKEFNNIAMGFNRGGSVPGYISGGNILRGAGTAAAWFGPQIGSAIGSRIGGEQGASIGSALGTAVQWAAVAKQLLGFSSNVVKGEGALARFAATALRARLLINPLTAGFTALAIAVKVINDNLEKKRKIETLAFAGAAGPLKSLDDQLKKARENAKAQRELRDLYASMIKIDPNSPTRMTVHEFEKLKASVKSTYPDLVKLLNVTENNDLSKTVSTLKAQFISAGDSVEKATQKVYTLLTLSNQAGRAAQAITSPEAMMVTDRKSSITTLLDSLTQANKVGGSRSFVAALNQSFNAMDNLIASSKDKVQGLNDVFDAIALSQNKNLKLTKDQLRVLSQQNPELANILSETDNVGNAFNKWIIALSGTRKSLAGLSDNEIATIAKGIQATTQYFQQLRDTSNELTKNDSFFGKLATQVDKLNKQSVVSNKALTTFNEKTKQQIADLIDLKQKQIRQIQEEADARKKALQEQQQQEDTKLQIQKEQLAYQDALASGNMGAAAQAQLNIQRLVGQSQLSSAEKAIDAAAKAKIDKLEAEIEKLRNAENNQGASLSSAATSTQSKSDKLKVAYNNMIDFIQGLRTAGVSAASPQNAAAFAKLTEDLKAAGATKEMLAQFAPSGTGVTYTSQSSKGAIPIYSGAMKDLGTILGDKMSSQIATNTGTMVDQLNRMITLMHGQPIAKGNSTAAILGGYTTFSPVRKATGGLISGPGTGKSDSILAYNNGGMIAVSNGEYIINADTVKRLGVPMLDQINKMAAGGLIGGAYNIPTSSVLPTMSTPPGFARGGIINHYDVGGFVVNAAPGQSEREIASMVVSMLDAKNMRRSAMNGINRTI